MHKIQTDTYTKYKRSSNVTVQLEMKQMVFLVGIVTGRNYEGSLWGASKLLFFEISTITQVCETCENSVICISMMFSLYMLYFN